MSFFSNLIDEVSKNGKTMAAVFLNQIPGVTSVPGLTTAFHTALADRTPASYVDLAVQVLLVVGASLHAKKLVVNAANKS